MFPQNSRSAHWDFVRGLSMLLMVIVNTSSVARWFPFGFAVANVAYPLIEPIIFLSGFLICLRTTEHVRQHPQKLSKIRILYALRRMIRTWPLYFLIVILCFVFPLLPDHPIENPFWKFATFTMNNSLTQDSGLANLWTLCLEEWCYFAFLFCIPFLNRKWISGVFIFLGAISLSLRHYMVLTDGPFPPPAYLTKIHFPTLPHWDSFWWGCLLAQIYPYRRTLSRFQAGLFLGGSVLVFLVYVILLLNPSRSFMKVLQVYDPVIGAIMAALVVWAIDRVPEKYLRATGLVQFGIMSYTFYLWHKVLLAGFFRINRSFEWLQAYTWVELLGGYVFLLASGSLIFYATEIHILNLLRTRFSAGRILRDE